jgi:hypothetical protein
VQQCGDALRLAGLLVLEQPGAATPLMHSQLARLSGQLAALQVGRGAGADSAAPSRLARCRCAPHNAGPTRCQQTAAPPAATPPSLPQGKTQQALAHFARDVFHCSTEYGPRDVRTSLGYYNLSKARRAALGGYGWARRVARGRPGEAC